LIKHRRDITGLEETPQDLVLSFASNSDDKDSNQDPRRNPRFMPNKKPPRPTNQLFFLLLMIFLVVLIFFAYKSPNFSSVQAVDFSTFWSMVKDGKVREVVIEDTGNIQFKTTTGFQETLYETYVPWVMNNPDILGELIEQGVKIKSQKSSGDFIWALLLNVLPLLLFVFIFFGMMRSMSGKNNQAFTFTKSPARMVSASKKRVTFKDVAGVDEAVEDLQELVIFLKSPQKFDKMKARMPKGVLLVGPPGTGKTLLARAVAGEANVPFFHMSGSDFVELFVGVGAARVRDLFNQAKNAAPSVIFIDEIDAVGRHRGAGLGGGHDEREQTLNQILVEMDGFEINEGVIVLAATNRPDILDPALLRPGRFDRKVVVDPPDVRGRESILNIYLKKRPLDPEIEVSVLARRTPGFVGADLENLCNEAALLAVRASKDLIGMSELEEAIDRVIAGPERKSRIISPKEKRIIAYHELGHALVSSALKNADPVHRVSIIPRGHSSLGHTLQLPLEDKFLMSKSEIYDKISSILGGRAAEEIVFDEITSGASHDIERATEMARWMVCQLGMSSALGPISWGKEEQEVFLGRDFSRMKNFSDDTAKVIDDEVKKIIEKCYNRAKEIIRKYKNLLDRLAEILLEKEVIDGEFLREMLCTEMAKENHKQLEAQIEAQIEPTLIKELG